MNLRAVMCITVGGLVLAASSGCGAKPKATVPSNAVAGVWVENISGPQQQGASGAIIVKNATNLKRLELNADGTYKWAMCDIKGVPLNPPQTVEGTWVLNGLDIKFTPSNKKVEKEFKGYDPLMSISVSLKSRGKPEDIIQTRDDNGLKTRYVRADEKGK
jgi:hypothetical protein